MRTALAFAIMWMAAVPARAQDLKGLKLEKDDKAPEGLEALRFTYQFDEKKDAIQGILLKPAGGGPFPAVVVNHGKGGSAAGFGREFGAIFAKKGYVVIACDLTHAGRDGGDSKTFAASKENAERIQACVRVLESLAYVDAKKLCIYGHSMGAFATVGTCTQTEKFRAAAITAGGLRNGDGLDTEKNVAKITTPVLILHGEADRTVKPELAKALKAAMDEQKKTSELKVFEGAGHDLPRTKRDEVFKLILEFFEKQLKQ